ncbi:hypothetical protein AB0F13_24235 [Streptomyces sp. NPDC026206]|uniref:hypothetical protein n=1 Tax=Streptomyces sp. NPDC026206 TaxID=3157089 RepID=UPI0033E0B9A5
MGGAAGWFAIALPISRLFNFHSKASDCSAVKDGQFLLKGAPSAALAKFDEAHALASETSGADLETTLDTSYCTPTYIEMQRANCWIDLGEPHRAVELFEDQLAALPPEYRNDRGVYLARLARAHITAGELERGAETASKALAIVTQTGSARTFTELSAVARAVECQRALPTIETFFERFELVRDRFAA